MKKQVYTIILSLIAVLDLAAQSTDRNYIKTNIYLDDTATGALTTIRYFDGMGRPVQVVQQNGGVANNQDLIFMQEYDGKGRDTKTWLPVYKTGNNGNYCGTVPDDAKSQYNNDTYAYSEVIYEVSPLNRIKNRYGPGQSWRSGNGHSVAMDYLINNASYPCGYFSVSGDNLVCGGYYAKGSLTVIKTTDEDSNVSCEFTDKWNRVILQRQMNKTVPHDTYYVYDDLGNLRFVLPPIASDSLFTTTQTTYNPASNTALKDYAYIYKYDERQRCKEKKLPGADPIYYVYDKADRLIFSQDGEQRTNSDWSFCKYDTHGRIILSGVWKNSGKTQADLVNQYQNSLIVELFFSSGAYGYSWSTLTWVPDSATLQANYYDNPDNLLNTLDASTKEKVTYVATSGYDTKYVNSSYPAFSSKGLLVGTRVKMLDNNSEEIVTAIYYDAKGRIVQQKSTNLLGGNEAEYYAYSFTGKPKKMQKVHTAAGKSTITEVYTYNYDHAERPTTTKYQLDNHAEITLSSLSYDNFGRINEKKLHGEKETIAYTYNIRNWLKTINSTHIKEKLDYYQYKGNILSTYFYWTTSEKAITRAYVYSYDGLDRMTKAQYLENSPHSSLFNEELVYDKHGNILELKRNAPVSPGSSSYATEQLYFGYAGNQLRASGRQVGVYDLQSVKSYNKNGSLTSDLKRKISEIQYNALNLPEKITFRMGHSTRYGYDATGVKRRTEHTTVESATSVTATAVTDFSSKEVSREVSKEFTFSLLKSGTSAPASGSSSTSSSSASAASTSSTFLQHPTYLLIKDRTVTDYCGNIVYENGILKYILNPEGYVTKDGDTPVYNYYLKDHLGNNRAVTSVNGNDYAVIQRTDYYPFGKPYPDGLNPERQPYKFGGKEYDEMHGINQSDFDARQLDVEMDRFTTMDPLAAKYYSISPYVYCGNNPINRADPDGMDWILSIGDKVYWYGGDYENTEELLYTFNASSGSNRAMKTTTNTDGTQKKEIIDVRYAEYQSFSNVGPTFEGKYELSL
jgi:RHS repeat-associated protein